MFAWLGCSVVEFSIPTTIFLQKVNQKQYKEISYLFVK
jgi:hypothetical protein